MKPLLVLQVYLHQMINLSTNILKVFQVSWFSSFSTLSWLRIITYAKSRNF